MVKPYEAGIKAAKAQKAAKGPYELGMSVSNKLKKRTDRIQSNKKNRQKIMGDDMYLQDMRETKSKIKAAVTPGDSVAKAKGREAVKRVGEYKRGVLDPGISKYHDKKNAEKRVKHTGQAKQHKADF